MGFNLVGLKHGFGLVGSKSMSLIGFSWIVLVFEALSVLKTMQKVIMSLKFTLF